MDEMRQVKTDDGTEQQEAEQPVSHFAFPNFGHADLPSPADRPTPVTATFLKTPQ